MSWNEIDVARRSIYLTRTTRKFVEPVLSFLMRDVHQRFNDTSTEIQRYTRNPWLFVFRRTSREKRAAEKSRSRKRGAREYENLRGSGRDRAERAKPTPPAEAQR